MSEPLRLDDFFSDELAAYKQEVVAFARTLGTDLDRRDREGLFSREDWDACAEYGIQGLCVPREYGGQGAGIARAVMAMEAIGYGCRDNGLAMALNAQMWTTQLSIQECGTEEQKKDWLPALCSGKKIACQAMTEPDAGSDAFSLTTEAKKVDGGYRITGRKIMVTLGPVADVVLLFATTDPSIGRWGVTCFAVDATSKGLTLEPAREKMGLRTVPMGHATFDDCFVPEAARIGAEGAGATVSTSSLEWERSCMLASQVGVMEHQLEKAVAYAREREQFGQPIGSFQHISGKIAEMKIRVETARMLIYKVAWMKSRGEAAPMEAAMAKYHLAECAVQSGLDAVRIHGGSGYLTETGVERDLRDAIGTLLWGGTSEIQKVIIAKLLGLR